MAGELQPRLLHEDSAPNSQARRVFASFKTRVSRSVLLELERSLHELVFKYDVRNRENRFVVGLAAELLVAAAMRAAGTDLDNVGDMTKETDLDVYVEKMRSRISVKCSFTEGQRDIRLVNYLGGDVERTSDLPPTIFLLPGIGIVYGDAGYVTLASAVQQKRDAAVIPLRAISRHAFERPDLVIALEVPVNRHTGTKVASREVARSIVDSPDYPSLGKWLRPEPSPRLAAEVREEIGRYKTLLDKGAITVQEFDVAKADLLRLLRS